MSILNIVVYSQFELSVKIRFSEREVVGVYKGVHPVESPRDPDNA